jgi:hypothetical protein
MTPLNSKTFIPLISLFVVLSGFFVVAKNMLENWGIDRDVLMIGNLFLFAITILSFFMVRRGIQNPNPHAFLRSMYSAIMVKLFLSIIAAFIYISIYKTELNKPALFILMGLYLLYTFIEVSVLMKLLRREKQ